MALEPNWQSVYGCELYESPGRYLRVARDWDSDRLLVAIGDDGTETTHVMHLGGWERMVKAVREFPGNSESPGAQ